MSILAAKVYDPAVAVSKATSALLALTAFDTTNLRNTFTVPATGAVMARIAGTIHGAAGVPSILIGILNGATVVARGAPMLGGVGTVAATSLIPFEIAFTITGLTPGASLTWDAAYGVETLLASSAIKYGGPNNTTTNDAFGALVFEVWQA